MLERVYVTEYVTSGRFLGLKASKMRFNPLSVNGSTRAHLLFPPTHFLFSCLSYFIQSVSEIALQRYRRGLQKYVRSKGNYHILLFDLE